jgi:hypothetical protein
MAAAVMVAVVTEVVAIWVVVTWVVAMSADLAARTWVDSVALGWADLVARAWEGLAVPGWADLAQRPRGPAQSLRARGWGGEAWAWVPGQG